MSKRIIIRRILPLILAFIIPTSSVFAKEPAEEDVVMQKEAQTSESNLQEPKEQSDDGVQEKNERTIEVEKEFNCSYGDVFSLEAKISEGVLEYESSDSQIAAIQTDEFGETKIKAVGIGDAKITITAPATESYEEISTEVEIHITKAEQVITAEDMAVEYGCEPFKIQADASRGNLSYESLNTEVVSVDTDGTVYCNKPGSAVVFITAPETEVYKETVKKITITVDLQKGTFKSGENVKNGISLTWNRVEGAKGYYLYRSTTGKSPWSKINTSTNAEDVNYTDTEVTEGKTYYYRVKAFGEPETVVAKTGETKKIVRIIAPVLSVKLASTGNQLNWNRVAGAGGYYVYRREPSQSKWSQVSVIKEPGEIAWRDTSAGNGKTYIYTVRAYKNDSISDYAAEKSYVRVTAPTIKSFKRASSTKFKLTWKTNSSANGYQIQYAQNGMFVGAKTKTIKSGSTSSYTISKLAKKKNYYARIRAYKKVNGQTYYSAWSASGNIKTTRTTKADVLTKKKKVFEIRSWAKQKMYQYDILQGSCSDGTYAYYLLNNKKASKCKVVKVKRSTLKVVKVSGALNVAHGNDMTYDSDKKRLVIVHSTGKDPKALTSVDPSTLTVIESKHITIPNKLAGGTLADAKNATAFTGLAYSSGRRQYAVLLSHNYNFVILDSNLDPVQYVKVSKKNNYTMQGIDATDDYILVAQSPKTSKQKYNIITVYDWDGNYISKVNVKKGYEIESIYHVGSKYYAGFYRSYYKTSYKTVVKKVKVNGKIKKKKVKVKYRKYQRDNYVYQISGI